LPRQPITVVLDGITQNYNIGAIFRLCDAFLTERLVICGTNVNLRKRKLVQAAAGTHWVPWEHIDLADAAVAIPMLGFSNSINVASAAA
jgi:tRNA G18 (ribose-2'-O)-methylase SpoU